MPDKHVPELPTLTDEEISNDENLWIICKPDADTLYQATIAQLKALIISNWKTVIAASIGGTVAASQKVYGQLTGNASPSVYGNPGNFSADEGLRHFAIPEDATALSLVIVTASAQPSNGPLVITLRKNDVATGLTVTIAANAIAGTYKDIIHEVDFTQGDVYSIELDNSGCNANSCILKSMGISFEKSN
jgi:hypothetical protein